MPLRVGDGSRLGMTMDHRYMVAPTDDGATIVRTTEYRYRILDPNGLEILAYHWHPAGVSPVTYPHVHLSGRLPPLALGPRGGAVRLGGMHLPTGGEVGAVTLADVVRLLITEFGVGPRRADWERIVAEAGRGREAGR